MINIFCSKCKDKHTLRLSISGEIIKLTCLNCGDYVILNDLKTWRTNENN